MTQNLHTPHIELHARHVTSRQGRTTHSANRVPVVELGAEVARVVHADREQRHQHEEADERKEDAVHRRVADHLLTIVLSV